MHSDSSMVLEWAPQNITFFRSHVSQCSTPTRLQAVHEDGVLDEASTYLAEGSQEQQTAAAAQHIFVQYKRDGSGTVHVQYSTNGSGFMLGGGGGGGSNGYQFFLDGGGGEDEDASSNGGSGGGGSGGGGGGSTPLNASVSAPVSTAPPAPSNQRQSAHSDAAYATSAAAAWPASSSSHPLTLFQVYKGVVSESRTCGSWVHDEPGATEPRGTRGNARSQVYDWSLTHDTSLAYGDPALFEPRSDRGILQEVSPGTLMHPMLGLEGSSRSSPASEVVLLLTSRDVFAPTLQYIFGIARMGRGCIVSTFRYIDHYYSLAAIV